jgi:hypothetical protein
MSGKKPPPNGELRSKPIGKRSKASRRPPDKLKALLAAAYDEVQHLDDRTRNARCRRNFVLHMTDWVEDLHRLEELYRQPEKFDQETATQVVMSFLYHVIPHLRAAGRLMLDYSPEDIFKELDCTEG